MEDLRSEMKGQIADMASSLDKLQEEIDFRRRLVKSTSATLVLDGFFLRHVPDEVGQVAGLAEALLHNNQLVDFPPCMASAPTLRALNLSTNCLEGTNATPCCCNCCILYSASSRARNH